MDQYAQDLVVNALQAKNQAKNQAQIEFAKMINFEPITYNYYDHKLNKWFFKKADKTNLTHFRHKITGKIYDSAQGKRMLNHHINNLPY